MKILTINELMALTRSELLPLLHAITAHLSEVPDGSREHADAELFLLNIRTALARSPRVAPKLRPPGP